MATLQEEIGEVLHKKGLKLGVVESATGGLISYLITSVAGSSDYYMGSVTSYSNDVKARVVGVKAQTIEKHGAVSQEVVEEMAEGGRKLLGVDVCVADTGIAGPGGATSGKPAGLFYIGLSHRGGTFSRKHIFQGTREETRRCATEAALQWVKEYLVGLEEHL